MFNRNTGIYSERCLKFIHESFTLERLEKSNLSPKQVSTCIAFFLMGMRTSEIAREFKMAKEDVRQTIYDTIGILVFTA